MNPETFVDAPGSFKPGMTPRYSELGFGMMGIKAMRMTRVGMKAAGPPHDQVLDCSNTSSCQSNSHPYPGKSVLMLELSPCGLLPAYPSRRTSLLSANFLCGRARCAELCAGG